MQTTVIPQSPDMKNLIKNTTKQGSKFYPYKTQNFRWNEYRKSRIAIVKKLHEQKYIETKQQSLKKIQLVNKEEKNNPEKQKETIVKDIISNKSPLAFKKNVNNIVDDNKAVEIKTVLALMEPIPLFVEAKDKSPQFKLHSLKTKPHHSEKQPQTVFRKTFCTSLHKPNKNRSLEIKALQRRPPTSNLETYRPVTRIRKVSNIGEESNNNFLAKYEIIKELGKGTYGTVYLAKIIKKKDHLPNLFNTSFFNASKIVSYQSERQRKEQENKPLLGQNLSTVIAENDSNLISFQNLNFQKTKDNQENPLQLQTLSQSTQKMQILVKRSDQKLQVSKLMEKDNTLIQENTPTEKNQNQLKQITDDDELVAIKVYEKFKMNKDPAKFKNIRKQITIMQNLNHEGVIKLYESVESITKISLVVEYGGQMSLLDYLRKNYPISQQKLKDFSCQLLRTIIYLHDKNIVHRDIKPQNILVKYNKKTNQESLKLIDYGFSSLTNKSRKMNVICGTPNFMAPELLSSKEYFGEKADVWSYGVVVFVMAEGRHPFKSSEYQELTRLANKGKYIFKRKHQPLFEQFVNQILKVNSDQRPTAAQILKFKWLQQQ